jgi:predicted MPP superfamily phosphohydrolase
LPDEALSSAPEIPLTLDAEKPPPSTSRRFIHGLTRVVTLLVVTAIWVAAPIAGAASMLNLLPYHAKAGGIEFQVQGSILTRPGLSADTTIGSWQFPHVDGLPIGAHISPQDVDVFQLADTANKEGSGFTASVQADIKRQLPHIARWLVGTALLGVLLGMIAAALIVSAARYLTGRSRRRWRWRPFAFKVVATVAALAALTSYGAASYNADWPKRSHLTASLGAAQLVPEQLQKFYDHQSQVYGVIGAIAGIQAQLQQQIGSASTSSDGFNVMYISDMHLGTTYPLVEQYAKNFDVKLIVNTGDETEFGTTEELTPTYLDQLEAITTTVPMIWLAGNHDSPADVALMRTIPGVIVLGDKVRHGSSYAVTAQSVDAYGLTIAGLPDPRVYGAAGAYGSDSDSVVDPLEHAAADSAVENVSSGTTFDIFATHEPVAAAELVKDLPGQIRQTNAGHLHKQNSDSDIQSGSTINLVEGSTGQGGLDALTMGTPPVPAEFSIETVAPDCQFTKVVRFQLANPAPVGTDAVSTYGQNVTASTIYLKKQPQDVAGRLCGTDRNISAVQDVP